MPPLPAGHARLETQDRLEASSVRAASGATVTPEGIAPARSSELSLTAALIDQGRYYHCAVCNAIVYGRMLIGAQPACPCCGHRKGWILIPMGEPKPVQRTVIHGP